MKRILSALLLCSIATNSFCSLTNVRSFTQAHDSKPQIDLLRQIDPSWVRRCYSYYPNGRPEKIIFFDGEKAVKELIFYDNGSIAQEADLLTENDRYSHHGASVLYTPNREIEAVAYYKNGFLHGSYKKYDSDGNLISEQLYAEGKPHGEAVAYFPDGSIKRKALYTNGVRQGEYVEYYSSGQKAVQSRYEEGLSEGKMTSWYENGTLKSVAHFRKGKLHNDKENPALVIYRPDKSIQEIQEYIDGVPVNTHITYHPNGKEEKRVTFVDGKINGKVLVKSIDGKILGESAFSMGVPIGTHYLKSVKGHFLHRAEYSQTGELKGVIENYDEYGQILSRYRKDEKGYDGVCQWWHNNGKLKETTVYKDGKKHGMSESFNAEGKLLYQGLFNEGKKEGTHLTFYETGELMEKSSFQDDLMTGEQFTYFKNGLVKTESFYVDNIGEGEQKIYAENGNLIFKVLVQKDLPQGELVAFYDSGEPLAIGNLVDGKEHGILKRFYKNGRLKSVQEYFHGKIINTSTEYYDAVNFLNESLVKSVANYDSEGTLHGEQRSYFENGLMESVVNYEAGTLQGLKVFFDSEGNKIEEAWYEAGLLHGPYMMMSQDKKEHVFNFVEGKKHGPMVVYHPSKDGLRIPAIEGYYKDAKKDGEFREYNPSGNLIALTTFKDDKKEGLTALYAENGALLASIQFSNDLKEGPFVNYYPTGIIAKKGTFVKDKLEGVAEDFFPTGALFARNFFKDGELDGVSVNYNEEGVKIFEAEYTKGKKSGFFNKFTEDGKIRLEQKFENDVLKYKKTFDDKGNVTEQFF
jgi:antitoxin component YwqK of YwqJK toxin-antitoxin module